MWSQERKTRIRDRSCYYLKCCEYFVITESCIYCKLADVEVLVSEKNNKYLVLSIFFFSRPDVVNLVKLGNVVVVDVEELRD